MLFNSVEYLFFLPAVMLLYFLSPYKFKWIVLLAASYFFYASWKPAYLLLIIISTLVDYLAGLFMGKYACKRHRLNILLISLFTNLGLLFIFKYYNFFSVSLEYILTGVGIHADLPAFKLLLPVGISFYTFQTLSYSIDVYKGAITPERHLGYFALYVSFFPQLVAGPIERSQSLLPQLRQNHSFSYESAANGLKLIFWGLFKKIVIADRLAVIVDHVYSNPHSYSGFALAAGTICFAFQIYCDFSGYSDIAIGSARILGIKLMTNFRRPYFAQSISQFWHRWHISLSSWFRDYLYIPLGGNRVVKWRWYYNLFLTFVLSGLWHGAEWTYILWGALHGFYLIAEIWLSSLGRRLAKIIKLDRLSWLKTLAAILLTFLLVNIGWIFFRADNISDALYIVRTIFSAEYSINAISIVLFELGVSEIDLIVILCSLGFMEAVHIMQEYGYGLKDLNRESVYVRWSVYVIVLFIIILWGVYDVAEQSQFIYFQF